jgi:hypothetical protein
VDCTFVAIYHLCHRAVDALMSCMIQVVFLGVPSLPNALQSSYRTAATGTDVCCAAVHVEGWPLYLIVKRAAWPADHGFLPPQQWAAGSRPPDHGQAASPAASQHRRCYSPAELVHSPLKQSQQTSGIGVDALARHIPADRQAVDRMASLPVSRQCAPRHTAELWLLHAQLLPPKGSHLCKEACVLQFESNGAGASNAICNCLAAHVSGIRDGDAQAGGSSSCSGGQAGSPKPEQGVAR